MLVMVVFVWLSGCCGVGRVVCSIWDFCLLMYYGAWVGLFVYDIV